MLAQQLAQATASRCNAYIQAMKPTNALCSNMANPSETTTKCLKYMVMSLLANPIGVRYCTNGKVGLERDMSIIDIRSPLTGDKNPRSLIS